MSLFAMIYVGLMGHNSVIRGSLLICLVTIVSMGGFSSFGLASANNCGGGQPEQSNGVWAWTFLIRGIASVVGSAAHLLTCGMLAHVCRSGLIDLMSSQRMCGASSSGGLWPVSQRRG